MMLPVLWADVKDFLCVIYCRAYGLYQESIRVDPERDT